MQISDFIFLDIIGIGILATTVVVFIWRGIIWMGMLSGVFWAMMGFFFTYKTQQGVVIMLFQEYMSILFYGAAVVMFLSFAWLKQKDKMEAELDAPSDIDVWKANRKAHRAQINELKNNRKDRYGDGDKE